MFGEVCLRRRDVIARAVGRRRPGSTAVFPFDIRGKTNNIRGRHQPALAKDFSEPRAELTSVLPGNVLDGVPWSLPATGILPRHDFVKFLSRFVAADTKTGRGAQGHGR